MTLSVTVKLGADADGSKRVGAKTGEGAFFWAAAMADSCDGESNDSVAVGLEEGSGRVGVSTRGTLNVGSGSG